MLALRDETNACISYTYFFLKEEYIYKANTTEAEARGSYAKLEVTFFQSGIAGNPT
jgi:hypothetical protein